MAVRPLQSFARMLAGVLRRVASALEGDAKGGGVEAAAAALAERFPGAPEHWLRYIAARAPHLADAEPLDADVSKPESPPPRTMSTVPRWRWPRLMARRRATLQLLPVLEPKREASRPESAEQGVMRAEPQTPRRVARPRLRVVAEAPSEVARKPAPLWEWRTRRRAAPQPASAVESATREPEPLRLAQASDKTRARIKLATPPERDLPASTLKPFAETRDAATRSPSPVAESPLQPSKRAERLSLNSAHRPGPAELLLLQPSASSRAPMPMWTRWMHARVSNAAVWPESKRPATPEPPHWQERSSPGPDRAAWRAEGPQGRWPTLLSSESYDAESAAARLPNIERLRAEQDCNAWSG